MGPAGLESTIFTMCRKHRTVVRSWAKVRCSLGSSDSATDKTLFGAKSGLARFRKKVFTNTNRTIYGLQCPGGIFLQKVVIFFLSLRAHQGQVFYPSNKSFAFLSLSWLGHPKNVRHDTHLSYWGSGALGGLLTQFHYLRNHPGPFKVTDPL